MFPECSKQLYTSYENILRIGGGLGASYRCLNLSKNSFSLEKPPTIVSENRYTSPKIDVFRTVISSLLLPPTGNNARASFGTPVPRTSASLAVSLNVFPPPLSVRMYLSSDDS